MNIERKKYGNFATFHGGSLEITMRVSLRVDQIWHNTFGTNTNVGRYKGQTHKRRTVQRSDSTNVQQYKHPTFNLNPILLTDLRE